jgi:WD40 repeat protein
MPPPVIPDHVLLRSIGSGAYGEVWLARNVMGTPRAVKVIWRRQFQSARPFEREFAGIERYEPVSRSSGGLVHVLHVGRNDAEGFFYYVMELADDAAASPDAADDGSSDHHEVPQPRSSSPALQDLASYSPRTVRADLKRLGRLSTALCLRLAIDVASGLAQLHRHGLIHRDVKPGNIIYVNGRAKLADIGLVTADGEGRTFVGTEGYIPPEGPGSPAADLYALGVVLYEASTGFSPERLPDVPSEWFTSPAGDPALELHEVILKACEGQRDRRYPNAHAFQADLALLQSGQSVRHTRALQRRYARLRLSGIVGTALLVLALVAAFFANYRARLAGESRAREAALRREAQQSQANAESAERVARQQLQATLYQAARALVLSKELGQRAQALEAIRQSAGSTNAAELRRVAFAALGLPDLRLERELPLPAQVTMWRLDPGLERIATGGGPEPVTIRSVQDLRVLATLPATTTNDAFIARWSADGRFLAVKRQYDAVGTRSELEVWNVSQTQLVFTVRQDVAYDSFSFHPQRPWLMAGHTGGAVSVWDLQSAKKACSFHLPDTAYALAYSPDGERVAASYQRGSNWVVAFHDATTGALLGATDCPQPASFIAWHPRGQWVSIGGEEANEWNRGVWLIAVDGGAMTLLGRHKIKTAATTFSPDGNYLMSCGWERELFCWDLRTRQRAFTSPNTGYGLDWSPDGTRCAMVSSGPRLQLYVFERPACLELTGNRGERLRPGAFSPDGRCLALPDSQNLCVWDLTCGSRPALLDAKVLYPPFFSPDGSQLFALVGRSGDARLEAWHISPALGPPGPPQLSPLPIAMQPGLTGAGLAGDELVLTAADGVRFIARTNLVSGEGRLVKIPSGQGTVSPDGRWLAMIYSFSPWVTVYRLPDVELVSRLETSHFVAGVWFAPAGDELVVINRGGLEQWDAATWRLRRRQPGFPISDSYVLYTPDGSGVWRLTSFRDTALCDRKTLEPILPLPPNVIPLALSADGRQLAVSVDDQRVRVWDLAELRAHFRELGLDWEKPPPH